MTQAPDMTAYKKRFKTAEKRMRTLMTRLNATVGGLGVYRYPGDTLGVGFGLVRDDGTELTATFAIWDSGDADDGIYGVHGNFVLDLVETDGRIVGQITPNNFSDAVWVDYADDAEWESRLASIENSEADIAAKIEQWKAED